jgi:hypothetical protein
MVALLVVAICITLVMPFSSSVEANPFAGAMLGDMYIVTPVFRDGPTTTVRLSRHL